jgi:Flp pilus assembly protein TadG
MLNCCLKFDHRIPRIFPNGRHDSRRGAAAVEMALVAPFILFLVFGAVEFGRMMMVKQVLTHAAREGSRHAALATSVHHDDVETVTRNCLRSTVPTCDDASLVRISVSPAFGSRPESGTTITTRVEVNCEDISWIPSAFLAGAKIRGSSSSQAE